MVNGSSVPTQRSSWRLTRSLSAPETWGFSLTGHMLWLSVIPAIHAALGVQAIAVWLPATLFGMMLNFQVKRLGGSLVDVAGGTPNYATRLLQAYPNLARYAAIGYFFSWVSVLPVNAIVLTDLIKVNLEGVGLACPQLLLVMGFTLLPFVLAFSGTRALSLLHLFFVVPAAGLLLAFAVQGLGWLLVSPSSPGLLPEHWSLPSFVDWAKWFLFVSFATYACETTTAFVAESRDAKESLRFLDVAAWLMPPIFMGASWVVMRLATAEDLQESAFLNLLTAALPFWGESAAVIVTFLLAAGCLLSCATVVSNAPRMLYQLGQDGLLAPVFGVVSRRGVLAPALLLTLVLSLGCLVWGDVAQIVAVGNVGWFMSIMALHLGLWLQRGSATVLLPKLAIATFGLEATVLVVGGFAWGWQTMLIGLLIPLAILGLDWAIRQTALPIFQPEWWKQRYRVLPPMAIADSIVVQVTVLIVLICAALLVGWLFGIRFHDTLLEQDKNLVIVLLLAVAFIGVAIAGWTSLPQVVAITEAREAAEQLFTTAQDAIVAVDEVGMILRLNPAATQLFGGAIGRSLTDYLSDLTDAPLQWEKRSEQIFQPGGLPKTLEMTISAETNPDFPEYVVILRDVTQRKQAEDALRQSEAQLRAALHQVQQSQSQLVQAEKMSSLGQMLAGIAHEINNPINFIAGNLKHANQYIDDLVSLIQVYQTQYPDPPAVISAQAEATDLDFLVEDLPKLLASMQMGTDRIQQIVSSLRTFSRTDSTAAQAIDLHECIDSTLMILHNRLKAKSDRPTIAVLKAYGDLPLVECYAGQLSQVFMNLIANAIDALEEHIGSQRNGNGTSIDKASNQTFNPSIRIRTQLLEPDLVQITIADNGAGIRETVKKRLFEAFFTTKSVGKGTGLGLSISYNIVTEKHGGQLRCLSTPGEGTEFMIEIPIQQAPQATTTAQPASEIAG